MPSFGRIKLVASSGLSSFAFLKRTTLHFDLKKSLSLDVKGDLESPFYLALLLVLLFAFALLAGLIQAQRVCCRHLSSTISANQFL